MGLIVPFGMDPLAIPVRDWRGKWFRLNQDGTAVALTRMDVTLDGPLDLIRLSPVHAVLKYQGIGLHIIDCDLRHHTNKPADGIRTVIITESKP